MVGRRASPCGSTANRHGRPAGSTSTSRATEPSPRPGSTSWSASPLRSPTARSRSPSSTPARGPTCSPSAEGQLGMDVKQIEAGDLDVGYVDAGPDDGPAVLLLHGWPYDIHAFAEVTPLLVAQGCRVVVPYLRGYGT